MTLIDRAAGRFLFGEDPAAYDRARPDYPRCVFDFLAGRCGLGPGARVLEIGAGTGKATGALIVHKADQVVAVEPDVRLAAYLRERFAGEPVTVIPEPFETAELSGRPFDLAVCATAFHWLEEAPSLVKIAGALRPGGWWAALWNIFGDPDRADSFHEATKALLQDEPTSPMPQPTQPKSSPSPTDWFALDKAARFSAFEKADAFEDWEHRLWRWELTLDPGQVRALYATFSNITVREDRDEVLDKLRHIAAEQFPEGVTRNMITSVFVARRREKERDQFDGAA